MTPLFLGLGAQEILIILAIVLLLFGGKKIPELMRGAGKGVRAFKDGMKEVTNDDEKQEETDKEEVKPQIKDETPKTGGINISVDIIVGILIF